jgi:flagellar hook-basal body complex protein FliE
MNAAALLAAKAYGATQSVGAGAGTPTGPAIADQGFNFASLLAQQISSTTEATKAAESQAANVVSGKGEMVDVVTAIAAAEVQMETMIAFRDQAIQAYQEIMRMPI